MFCTREPSFSHAAPCALFVSARGTRHAFAFVGLAPKFFRWNHGAPQNGADQSEDKSEAAWQFRHLYKKEMVRRSNEAISGVVRGQLKGSGAWRSARILKSRAGSEAVEPGAVRELRAELL
jgi:hypothetical protein